MPDIYVPSAADAINAFEAGREGAMARRKLEAHRQIGGAMARGDYQAAAQAAFGAGDYAAGAQIDRIGRDQQAQERRRGYGQQIAAGDFEGAKQSALGAGDLDFYGELAKVTDAKKMENAKAFGGILRAIGSEPEDAWDDLISANRTQLEALDIPASEIDFFIQASPEQRRVLMSTMLSRADMLDNYLKERMDERKFAAEQENRKRDDARADEQLAISRGQLGVSQGNLALSRQREGRIAAGGGAAGGGWEEF